MDSSQITFCKMLVLLTISTAVASRYSKGSLVQASRSSLKKLTNANNYFALNLYRLLTENAADENVIFSPLSLSMVFGMLLLGARGDTAEEIRKALGYEREKLSDELVHLTFQRYLTEERAKSSYKGYTLNIANAIILDKRFPLLSGYRNATGTSYGAPVQNMDIVKSSSKVKDGVNHWVNTKTNGKIERLLDDLSAETIMIILNAVYFKGLWYFPFDSFLTANLHFFNNGQDSLAKKVPTMQMVATELNITATEDYQALELPYEGNISMLIFLPTERNGLPALEANMTWDNFNSIRKSMKPADVTVFLPKFSIEYTKSMNNDLKELGMQTMYQSSSANLTGISRTGGLKVSDVVHKAFVSVDEIGSEAAAATSLNIVPYSGIRSDHWFIADHPFLFAIYDKTSGMILFLGRVNSL